MRADFYEKITNRIVGELEKGVRPWHQPWKATKAHMCYGAFMTTGNPELRAELQRLTVPPGDAGIEWLDVQILEMEELNKRIPHSVRLHTRLSRAILELNCFMFALDIAPDAVADMCLGHIFPGQRFVKFLLAREHLRETEAGTIAIYFRDGLPEHAGKRDGGTVISKWGSGGTHIWEHALWDVPAEYGDEVRFFAGLPGVVDLYLKWAEAHGI